MVSERQHVVNYADADDEVATFVADVLELAGVFRQVGDDIARREGQTQTVWYALSVFSGEPLTVAQAARRLGTTRQAVQRTSNDLIARGLAVAQHNPDHRASPFIVLTDAGRRTLRAITRAAARWRKASFAERDVMQVRRAHPPIKRLLERMRSD